MLFILRQLRRLELRKRSGQYFLYAFGEIVLIVVGILIALQVSNWNVGRLSKQNERALLTALMEETEVNTGRIDSLVQLHEHSKAALLELIDINPLELSASDKDDIDRLLIATSTSVQPAFQRGALDAIILGGKLEQIESLDLQSKISHWNRMLEAVESFENSHQNFLDEVWSPYFRLHGNLAELFGAHTANFDGSANYITQSRIGERVDHSTFLVSREFLNMMQEKIAMHEVALKMKQTILRQHLDELVSELKAELND